MTKKYSSGLTLVELMVTVVVAIVLLGAGLPLMRGMLSSNQLLTESNALVNILNLARSQAVTEGRTAVVCAEASAGVCASGADAPWENGYFAFTDVDGDGVYDPGPDRAVDDQLIRHRGAFSGQLAFNQSPVSVVFQPTGEAQSAEAFELRSYGDDPTTALKRRCVAVGAVGGVQSRLLKTDSEVCP